MSTPDQPPPPPRERVLLAAGTATYQHGAAFTGGLSNLEAIPKALETIVGALTSLGYSPAADKPFLLNPEANSLKKAISTAAREAPMVVVYYTGHGLKPESRPFYLLTADSDENWLEITAVKAEEILTLVHRPEPGLSSAEQPQVLVILDCCYSGAGGIETLKSSLEDLGNPNVWVLASAGSREWAQQGLFAQVFTAVVHEAVGVGAVQKFIDPVTLMVEINKALEAIHADQRTSLFPPRGRLKGAPPQFFHNPKYVPDMAGLTVEERQVWVNRLRAAPEQTATDEGFYLTGSTGRIRAMQDIAAWLGGPAGHGLAVVTGSPGSGKSTLLALPALLADPAKAAAVLAGSPAHSLITRAAELFAGLSVLSLYGHGKDSYQVTRTIGDRLGLTVESPEDLLRDLAEQSETTSRILIIDAVDEAVNPMKLMDDLLLPLARCPGTKVLIGTRRHLLRHYEAVVPAPADLLVDLDADAYQDPQALTEYAHQLLVAAHERTVPTPYRDAPEEVTTAVAEAIAARATAPSAAGQEESFLLAQLLARAVRSRGQIPDVTTRDWVDQLPADVGGAFDEVLARLDRREPAVRALLTALAWAKGPGLPWENIWSPVARALAEADSDSSNLGSNDVRWLLRNVGRYVVEDLGAGQRSAFRPFHDLLAAHLRGEPGREKLLSEPDAADAWHERSQHIETAITEALLGTVPAGAEGHRDWELAHPYLRTYLAQHAHAAGPDTFAALIADPDYLAVADPTTLTPLLTPTDPALRTTARAYRRARPLLGQNANDNAAYLQEAFVAETGQAPTPQRIRPTYRTLMARTRRDDNLLTLTGHTGWVSSVSFATSPDGRLLLASVDGGDGTIRIWDAVSGSPAGDPIPGHTVYAYFARRAASVALGTMKDGRLLLASARRWDDNVRVWDPITGTPVAEMFTHRVLSVAFGTASNGRLFLASGGYDGSVRLWDPVTGTPVGNPLAEETVPVRSVAFGVTLEGHLLLASADDDGIVRLWNALTTAPVGKPLTAHPGPVTSVAFGNASNGHLILASASNGTARVWDLSTGVLMWKTLSIHNDEVESVAFGSEPNARLLLATAGGDGAVRLWNAATGAPVGAPLTGHTDRVASVAFGTTPDNHLLLASAGDDGTVRVWDPTTATTESEPLTGYTGAVTSMAFGTGPNGNLLLAFVGSDDTVRLWDSSTGIPEWELHNGQRPVAFGKRPNGTLLLATGHTDNTVRVWDPSTREPAGKPLTGYSSAAASVAFATASDGRLLVATGHEDGTTRVWDPPTGEQVIEPLTGQTGDLLHTAAAEPAGSVAFGTEHGGRLILATTGGGDGVVRLYDPVTGTPVCGPLIGHTDHIETVAFGTMPDGHLLLASASRDFTVRLWDPIAGTPRPNPLTGHTGWVTSLTFGTMPDGRLLLASAGRDFTVRLWDAVTGTVLKTLRRRTHVNAVALRSMTLAIADDEGMVILEIPPIAP